MIVDEGDYIAHYGILRRSGRYPWGSGGNQETRNRDFLSYVKEMKDKGLSEREIAQGQGITLTQLRAAKTIANAQQKQSRIAQAQALHDKGYSNVAGAARMGIPESSYRALLKPGAADRANVLMSTADMLKKQVGENNIVDIGANVENYIGVSKERKDAAVAILQEQGYEVHTVKTPQIGTGFDTRRKVLAAPGTTQRDVFDRRDEIKQISAVTEDHGHTFSTGKRHDAIAVHPNRVQVRYKEEGGGDADGVIFVREGAPDISLGLNRYAQVRVQVGDNHYLKGMAMYKENMPPGVDLVFNTAKSSTGNKLDAMKEINKDDPELPFGAVVRQILADPGGPHERNISAMNIVNDETNWTKWSKTLSSQFLSKQKPELAQTQLDLTFKQRKKDLEEINALTNPTVKKHLLEKFADSADSASVHLKAARLPRQGWHAILPIESISPHEIYATGYRDGEKVVLVRYPHGGTFEIPELTVNNRHRESRRLLQDAKGVVGIHHSVAKRLSGADFDGDTVLVIPNNRRRITHSPALEGLKDFDPISSYKNPPGVTILNEKKKWPKKQQEMGDVSNLITDMTIKGAPHSQIAQAVRHSMVVIDAEKHDLNVKLSAERNGIAKLKEEYQGRPKGGASTLISRAGARKYVPHRELRKQSQGGPIDTATGRKVYVPTGKKRKSGKDVQIRSKKLAEVADAFELTSGPPPTRIEKIYAEHSNRLKNLANQARLSSLNTPPIKWNASSKRVYAREVASLDSKLHIANKNRPLERHAQSIANANVRARIASNPTIDDETKKKIKFQALEEARARVGASKKHRRIEITPREWDAIQAGAVSNNKLEQILDNTDIEVLRKYATPRPDRLMTPSNLSRAKAMLKSGATRAEVADALGVSLSTLDRATNG